MRLPGTQIGAPPQIFDGRGQTTCIRLHVCMMDWAVSESRCLLPVTALEFCSFHRFRLLILGEGPLVKVFSEDGQLMCMQEALPFRRVHGIRPDSDVLLVFGQKAFCISQLLHTPHRLCFIAKLTELSDWILDAAWLGYKDSSCYSVAFVTAHNTVLVYSVTGGSLSTFICQSEVNCILYSACALYSDSECDLTLASGTVFNKILLWHLSGDQVTKRSELDSRVKVSLTLSGHEGVIFSIKFNDDRSRLVSGSDDRTIHVWNLPPNWKSSERSEELCCSLVLYGHTARVWDARLLPDCIVSIGEDVTCRVWDLNGQCKEVVRGHKGRSIWSMAIDDRQQVIATGGGDCSVRTFQLSCQGKSSCKATDTRLPCQGEAHQPGSPRSVVLSGRTALCLTSNGYLYAANVTDSLFSLPIGSSEPWREISHNIDYSGYCVLAVCESHSHMVSMGNLKGSIKLLSISDAGSLKGTYEWGAHEGKVFSLHWTTLNATILLLSCGPDGKMVCWNVCEQGDEFTVSRLALLSLPPSKHRWISAVTLLSSVLKSDSQTTAVCGDRKGSVHVYHCTLEPSKSKGISTYQEPVQSLRLHGPNGVTSIVSNGGYVYTAGRDGCCRRFSLGTGGLLIELSKFKPVKGMDWIEKLIFYKEDLLVLGFHATSMVLHSTAQNKHIMEVSCGGGHRSYGTSTVDQMTFEKRNVVVFIKQSLLCFRETDLHAYFTQPVIQEPFVGREAVSLCTIYEDQLEGNHLVAVGSEDCTISLVRLCSGSKDPTQCIKTVATLQGHISSVRTLSCSPSGRNNGKRLLFSGGARASLKVWSVGPACIWSEDTTLEAELFLHDDPSRLRRRRAKLSSAAELPPECRVMSLSLFPLTCCVAGDKDVHSLVDYHYVAAGCSDAMIRQYIYDEREKQFMPLSSLTFHNKCVLCVSHFFHAPHSQKQPSDSLPCTPLAFLCSTATDGRVAVWSLEAILCQWMLQHSSPSTNDQGTLDRLTTTTEPSCIIEAHQSGINAISVCSVEGGGRHLVASVGDDNAVTVSEIEIITAESTGSPVVKLISQCSEKSAHSSSITGVKFLKANLLATTSVDQRLNLWSYKLGARETMLKLTSSFTHDVADVASMELLRNRDCTCIVFCGIGLQYFCLTPNTQC